MAGLRSRAGQLGVVLTKMDKHPACNKICEHVGAYIYVYLHMHVYVRVFIFTYSYDSNRAGEGYTMVYILIE